MSFRKNKYQVIKKAISSEIAGMAFNYLLLKQQVAESFLEQDIYRLTKKFLEHGEIDKFHKLFLYMEMF